MEDFKCPVCGGTLEISLFSASAVCESCGNRSQVDFNQTKEYRQVYHEAEKLACLNTVDGYTKAIELLDSIPFVKEAKEKSAAYHKRIQEIREKKEAQQEAEKTSGKHETVFGIALIVLVILIVLAAVAAGAVIFVRLVRGELSTQTTIILVIVIAVLVVGAIVGKIKG
ncbi:MAG: hypothetical protein IJU96_07995 [Clostridia bacterium]|nr:hypothetical protein [Clostridia bacterium]